MIDLAASEPVAEATLDTIVRCIRAAVEPELVLLFGSRAAGNAREDSDYDLMLVLRDQATLESNRNAVRGALVALRISADVLVRTVEQYERQQRDPGLLDFVIAREGRVLYASGRVPQRFGDASRVREDAPGEGLAMWLRRAGADFRSAEQLLAADDPVWDSICFHSHAGVEKLLKATVVRGGAFPPRTHDLPTLLELQPAAVRTNAGVIAACELLTRLLPRTRYPELPEPMADEARQAFAAAREVRRVFERDSVVE